MNGQLNTSSLISSSCVTLPVCPSRHAIFFFCRSRPRSFQDSQLAQEQLPFNLSHDASISSNRDGARADALWPNGESHTIVSRVDWTSDGLDHFPHTTPHQHFFTSNTLPTAHRNISRRTTDAAHHTQESANSLPTPCRIFTVTEPGACRMHVQTFGRLRENTLQNTTVVVPIFFVLSRMSAVPFVTKIDHNLPGVCHEVFNTYIHKMELHKRNDMLTESTIRL